MTKKIVKGSKVVVIDQASNGTYKMRLYVNYGETATLISGQAKTLKSAEQVANRMLRGAKQS